MTQEAFAPFGRVIEVEGAERRVINEGTTERFHDLAPVDVAAEGGRPLISLFRAQPRPAPIEVRMLERHPLGSQAFVPLDRRPWLVVVGEGGERPDLASLRAFVARGDQGVSYGRNVWHHPLLVLDRAADFLVVDRGGPGDNLQEAWFEPEDRASIALDGIKELVA